MKIEWCLLLLLDLTNAASLDQIYATRFDVCNVAHFGVNDDLILNLKQIYKSDRIHFNHVDQLTTWPNGRSVQFAKSGMFESYVDSDLIVFGQMKQQRNCLHSAPGSEAPRGVVIRTSSGLRRVVERDSCVRNNAHFLT